MVQQTPTDQQTDTDSTADQWRRQQKESPGPGNSELHKLASFIYEFSTN